jgi:hypothetical protein
MRDPIPTLGRVTSDLQRCTKEQPMPKGAPGRWEHEGAKNDGECSDGCCDYYRCVDCGHWWRQEVAQ